MLDKLIAGIDRITEVTGRSIAWLTLAMVALTCAVVVLRYGLEIGSIALQESVIYFHAVVFLLGAGYTLRHDGHVRVDIFYRRMGPRARAAVNLIGTLCLLIPVSLFIAWSSWEYVSFSWQIREDSQEAGGLPYVYLLKSLIPMLSAVLILQGVAEGLRNLQVLLGRPGRGADTPGEDLHL